LKRLLAWKDGSVCERRDPVAEEEPLEIRIQVYRRQGLTQHQVAVTMRTPGHDLDLALGFLMSEGLIATVEDYERVDRVGDRRGDPLDNVVQVRLAPGREVDLERLSRRVFTHSGCGVCGKTSIESVRSPFLKPVDGDLRISPGRIEALPERMRAHQELFDSTGGVHATAVFDSSDELLVCREDVGRHNAMDKVNGWLLRNLRLPIHHGIVAVSGRASFELVQKTVTAGAAVLVAVGAPTSLAVELADEFGLTLAGFARRGRFNVYSHAQRIRL